MQIDKVFIGNIIHKQKYIFINTNFHLDRQNNAFLVGTVYSLLRQKCNNLPKLYGDILKQQKFGVQYICDIETNHLYSFPTRHHFKDSTNFRVFRKSCAEIVYMLETNQLKSDIPLYIPIILQNTKTITFDDLIEQANNFFEDVDNIHLILCWGNLD